MNDIKYKYTLTFHKEDLLIFLSQLDLMRLFARVLQKTKLPVVYSQGFNPHPRYSLPYPLPVGYASAAEILEIYLTTPVNPEIIKESFNRYLPADIQILSAVLGEFVPKYVVKIILESPVTLPAGWPELVLTKETKKGDLAHYRLGEHIDLKTESNNLYITLLSDKSLKAEKICALLGITQIVEIRREIKKEAVLNRLFGNT